MSHLLIAFLVHPIKANPTVLPISVSPSLPVSSSSSISYVITYCLWFTYTLVGSLQLFMAARSASYSYICQRVDYSDDPNEVRVSQGFVA